MLTGSIFFPATRQCLKYKVPRGRQQSKRRFLVKSQFTFFQTFSRLLQIAYFVKCRQTQKGKKVFFVCLCPQQYLNLGIFTSCS